MAASTVMPKNWTDFLRIDENKTELFAFLSPEAIRLPLIGTVGRSEGTVCNRRKWSYLLSY